MRGVTSLSVVGDLDVLEHRLRELDSGLPTLTVERLCLPTRSERFHHGVVEAVTDGSE